MDDPRRPVWREAEFWLTAWTVALTWVGLNLAFGGQITGHNPRDSYTLMALAWRKGQLSLGQDYPWLELAIYRGDWYVSFPSVPALVMLPLTFLFGADTPNTLATGLYYLFSALAAYALCRRWRDPRDSLLLALMMTLGGSLLDFSLSGGVWNQAQLLCLLLTTGFALGISGDSRAGWAAGLTCLALSVGCRPFQAVYVPFGLAALDRKLRERKPAGPGRRLLAMVPYCLMPGLVALALGAYNYARFGDPLEFGHNYLPEFTRNPDQPQLGLQYVGHNIENLLRLPGIVEGHIEFPRFDGFAFWLVDPLFVSAAIAGAVKAFRKRWDALDTLLALGFLAETFLLLMHKTFGGWQYGARYLCDLYPMLLLFQLRPRRDTPAWEKGIALASLVITMTGTIAFHLMELGVWGNG